ncbi:uncharacterized protein LOC112458623, partial [Temnothorax curvispinosus]|uniref:Uncharacterized protein LOC112458623 n=1 Tax=Temnothorax curvispinosus TaxID=300111 RepID=A0A6J1Q7C6_9HYME
MNSQSVSKRELEAFRGDAVGNDNDLHSSKWVNDTLKSLNEIGKNSWTKELEDQLCALWYLTNLKGDVISHLMLYDFPKIAKRVLVISTEPRLIEIILGIIGNVCSSDKAAIDTIGRDRELVTQILSYLKSDNSLILIQLVKILKEMSDQIIKKARSVWVAYFTKCAFFGDCIISILMTSTNDELLTGTMDLVASIFIGARLAKKNKLWEKLFKIDQFIVAMLESFTGIMARETRTMRETSRFEWKFAYNWLGCLNLIIIDPNHVVEGEICDNGEMLLKLLEIIYRILEPCNKLHNLYPIREASAFLIYNATCILSSIINYNVNVGEINHILATITFSLRMVSESRFKEELDPEELVPGLSNYLDKYWSRMSHINRQTDQQIAEIYRQ